MNRASISSCFTRISEMPPNPRMQRTPSAPLMRKPLGRPKLHLVILAVLAAALALPAQVRACQCGSIGPVNEAWGRAGAIFVARVSAVSDQWTWWRRVKDWFRDTSRLPEDYERDYGFLVTLEMQTSWKGPRTSTVHVLTGRGGGDCGYSFKIGEQYLVYAATRPDGLLSTSICSRTSPLGVRREDLQQLDQLAKASSP